MAKSNGKSGGRDTSTNPGKASGGNRRDRKFEGSPYLK